VAIRHADAPWERRPGVGPAGRAGGREEHGLNNLLKNIGIWLVIGLVVLTVVKQFDSRQSAKDSVAYSDFIESARSGRVESATVEGRSIKWVSTDKKRYVTYSPGDIWMVGDLV
jgi:cell division protease FtsH